jgi:hypothetical protein
MEHVARSGERSEDFSTVTLDFVTHLVLRAVHVTHSFVLHTPSQ